MERITYVYETSHIAYIRNTHKKHRAFLVQENDTAEKQAQSA